MMGEFYYYFPVLRTWRKKTSVPKERVEEWHIRTSQFSQYQKKTLSPDYCIKRMSNSSGAVLYMILRQVSSYTWEYRGNDYQGCLLRYVNSILTRSLRELSFKGTHISFNNHPAVLRGNCPNYWTLSWNYKKIKIIIKNPVSV